MVQSYIIEFSVYHCLIYILCNRWWVNFLLFLIMIFMASNVWQWGKVFSQVALALWFYNHNYYDSIIIIIMRYFFFICLHAFQTDWFGKNWKIEKIIILSYIIQKFPKSHCGYYETCHDMRHVQLGFTITFWPSKDKLKSS